MEEGRTVIVLSIIVITLYPFLHVECDVYQFGLDIKGGEECSPSPKSGLWLCISFSWGIIIGSDEVRRFQNRWVPEAAEAANTLIPSNGVDSIRSYRIDPRQWTWYSGDLKSFWGLCFRWRTWQAKCGCMPGIIVWTGVRHEWMKAICFVCDFMVWEGELELELELEMLS